MAREVMNLDTLVLEWFETICLHGRGGSIASHQHVETASSVSAGLAYVRQLVVPPSPVSPSYMQRN